MQSAIDSMGFSIARPLAFPHMLLERTLNKTLGNAASLQDALEHGGRTRRSQLKTNLGLWIDF
jgi:hypothetical protein